MDSATGTFDGDRMLVSSAELRVPITSVLSGAKIGLTAFMDAGKAFNVGQSMKDATWHQGVGGGVFLIATIVRINLDVAHGLRDGDTRGASELGVQFLARLHSAVGISLQEFRRSESRTLGLKGHPPSGLLGSVLCVCL